MISTHHDNDQKTIVFMSLNGTRIEVPLRCIYRSVQPIYQFINQAIRSIQTVLQRRKFCYASIKFISPDVPLLLSERLDTVHYYSTVSGSDILVIEIILVIVIVSFCLIILVII